MNTKKKKIRRVKKQNELNYHCCCCCCSGEYVSLFLSVSLRLLLPLLRLTMADYSKRISLWESSAAAAAPGLGTRDTAMRVRSGWHVSPLQFPLKVFGDRERERERKKSPKNPDLDTKVNDSLSTVPLLLSSSFLYPFSLFFSRLPITYFRHCELQHFYSIILY